MTHRFVKMNGLGNDFIVVEARRQAFLPDTDTVRALAKRQGGIGCDQLIALEPSARSNVFMRIWNADGSEAGACGNATRCVGQILLNETGAAQVSIDTLGGVLIARRGPDDTVTVDMGKPGLDWQQIPLARAMDTRAIDLEAGSGLSAPGCVSMGNPHVVFFVADVLATPVTKIGPVIEHDPLFPQAVNVGFAQVLARDRIRLKVWERGAGLTLACGTGACAALVAAHRQGLTDRKAVLVMDGGELQIEWRASDDHVLMTGPVETEFEGLLP
jgi:diaminopimelate epimerase